MSNFKGYLLKAIDTDVVFPHQYIALESYESTPKQREELKAYRDDNTRDLFRITADGMKTAIKFATLDGLSLNEKTEVLDFFKNNEVIAKERKIHLEYWDDDNNTYDEGYFYRANQTFKIKEITDDDITYNSVEFSLTEY